MSRQLTFSVQCENEIMTMRMEREKNDFQEKTMIQLVEGEKGIVLEGVKRRGKGVSYNSFWMQAEEQEEDIADFASKWVEKIELRDPEMKAAISEFDDFKFAHLTM